MSTGRRVVRIDGRAVDPDGAAVSVDDPLVRAGDGLIETMRGRRGRVFRLERHLARLRASAATLGLAVPDAAVLRAEVDATIREAGSDDLRLRLCVGSGGTVWVEGVPIPPPARLPAVTTAIALPGAWAPDAWIAEHKTASRALWAWAQRRAAAEGVGTALLLDADGRMGEAVTANVLVVTGGRVLTAPARGLLPGVGREVALQLLPVVEVRAADEAEWRGADEILTVGVLAGVTAVTRLDGVPVGPGVPGPVARRLTAEWRDLVDRETG